MKHLMFLLTLVSACSATQAVSTLQHVDSHEILIRGGMTGDVAASAHGVASRGGTRLDFRLVRKDDRAEVYSKTLQLSQCEGLRLVIEGEELRLEHVSGSLVGSIWISLVECSTETQAFTSPLRVLWRGSL